MQSAHQPNVDRGRAKSLRAPSANRTLVWFNGDAERRRRTAAAAHEASSPSTAAGASAPAARAWQRPELFGCIALAALVLAMVEEPVLNAAGGRPCHTEPAILAPGIDRDVRMTVSHGAACAIWTKAANISVQDVTVTVPPQHGTLALRGRTGVTYRPARGFRGNDFFSFTLQSASAAGGTALTARVSASVQ
jgi:hypothetical protein